MNALCVGGASCVWDDLDRIPLGWGDVVIACNDIGIELPGIDHWCTLHPEKFDNWREQRRLRHYNEPQIWFPEAVQASLTTKHGYDHIIDHPGGSSGLMCVTVAQHLGASEIVLAGIPLTPTPHNHALDRNWYKAETFREAWVREHKAGNLKGVTSMSGWTQELLGEPLFMVHEP